MKKLLEQSKDMALAYLEAMNDLPIQVSQAQRDALQEMNFELPAEGKGAEDVIEHMNRVFSQATMKMTSSKFFGFVIGGAYPVSIASSWLATAWDQNTGLEVTTPAAAMAEQVSASWMLDLFGLPKSCATAFVTGATVANFTALAAARNQVLKRAGWDVEADGLIGAPEVQVIISEESHPTVYKSLGMLGFGRNRVTRVPTDDQGRMRLDAFPEVNEPAIIITQAGNINSGACDPIGAVCKKVAGKNTWVHVDGAFGMWVLASPKHRHLLPDIALADSWATDAHKWLNVPYDSGLAFVKHPDALKAAMSIKASYLPTENAGRNPSDYTPELSRRARGFDTYAVLYHLGQQGVAELIERCIQCAQRFAEGFKQAGFEVMNEVVMNQVVVSFGSDEDNAALIEAVQKDGTCWVGPTQWKGRLAMRISVCNWQTQVEDVDDSLKAINQLATSIGPK